MDGNIFALGFFDGVHLGHQALLDECGALARALGAQAGAVTFRTHPEELTALHAPRLINTLADRVWLLKGYGMGLVVALDFDEALRTMPWGDFLALLRRDWDARGFVCGADFRFGYRGEGSAASVEDYCQREGLAFQRVEDQILDGRRVSSSHIRTLLEQGQLEEAGRFLGHAHVLRGRASREDGRLRLAIPGNLVKLPGGIYECQAQAEGRRLQTSVLLDEAGLWLTAEEAPIGLEGREITLELMR